MDGAENVEERQNTVPIPFSVTLKMVSPGPRIGSRLKTGSSVAGPTSSSSTEMGDVTDGLCDVTEEDCDVMLGIAPPIIGKAMPPRGTAVAAGDA